MSDPLDFSNKYNTALSKADEAKFLKWAEKNNKLNDVYDYDIRGAWKALQKGQMSADERGHLGDMFKKPNHPTFSDQSIYHGKDNYFGGSWTQNKEGKYTFVPSPTSLWKADELQRYFKEYEPDATLQFPKAKTQEVVDPYYVDPFGFSIQ